jgi:hypothetical protein
MAKKKAAKKSAPKKVAKGTAAIDEVALMYKLDAIHDDVETLQSEVSELSDKLDEVLSLLQQDETEPAD